MAGSNKAVWAGFLANLAITIVKAIGALIGRSSSLLAETLHSTADTADSLMLLWGENRAARPPDVLHPFGHGKDLYFWTLVVAVSIFTVAGVTSIAEGVVRVIDPPRIEDPFWSYVVLIVAGVFELASMVYAWRSFTREKGENRTILAGIRVAKDPSTFMVVFEDTASFVGVLIALAAIWLEHHFREAWIDGAGAIAVGLLMATVATFLVYEVRKLLIGERAVPELLEAIERTIRDEPTVADIGELRTLHFGPKTVLLTLRAQFTTDLSGHELARSVQALRRRIEEQFDEVKYVYLEPVADPADLRD